MRYGILAFSESLNIPAILIATLQPGLVISENITYEISKHEQTSGILFQAMLKLQSIVFSLLKQLPAT